MSIVFVFPGYEQFAKNINTELGDLSVSYFPDGESLVTIKSDVKDKEVTVICGLDNPDTKIMALAAETAPRKARVCRAGELCTATRT